MKMFFLLAALFSAAIFPLACGGKNNSPTNPAGGNASPTNTAVPTDTFVNTPTQTPTSTPSSTTTPTPTKTPTSTVTNTSTPVPTNSPTPSPTATPSSSPTDTPTSTPSNSATNSPTPSPTGTPTNSPTPTWTSIATPVFDANYATAAAPNGFYYNGTDLWVAEAEIHGGTIADIEELNVGSGGSLSWLSVFNTVVTGVPTPSATPAWQGTTINLSFPRALAVSGNYWALLDNQSDGGATLWVGNKATWPSPDYGFGGPYEGSAVGYGGVAFNQPTGLAGDSSGNFYVADAGNGSVEMFSEGSFGPIPIHRWSGSASVNFTRPSAVACDSGDNVWVGDSGTSPSQLLEFSSNGTTCLGSWNLIPGCVINGLAVYNTGGGSATVYVSDTGNGGQVEEYLVQSPTDCNLFRMWGDPHAVHEFQPFVPSCIVPDMVHSQILVGDTGNDLIQVFGP